MLIALLLAPLARAADDAPLAVPLVPGFTCVPDAQRVNEGKAMASCQGELGDLKKGNVIIPTAGFVAGAAGLVVISVVLTVVLVKATEKQPSP
jgi:hypothetical protein